MVMMLVHFHTSLFLSCGSGQKDQAFETSLDSLRLCLNTPSLPCLKKRMGDPNRWQTSRNVVNQCENSVLFSLCVSHEPVMTENLIPAVLRGKNMDVITQVVTTLNLHPCSYCGSLGFPHISVLEICNGVWS